MCGLAGVVGVRGDLVEGEVAVRMAARLVHRGPDDSGCYAAGPVALGFRRLSILDLTPAGHQPFLSADGRVAMVFNGEIFNYTELRDELRGLGHTFKSTGDTEVLLAAYLQWGVGCLPRLNGMWAFLIHDTRTGTVFGARDRFGVKPLYHVQDGGRRFFASEIKALHAVSPASRQVNWSRIAAFLAGGRLENVALDGATFFEAVREVAPGTWFVVDPDGGMQSGRYWELPEEAPEASADPVGEFRDLFLDAVGLELRSDVPVGVALSGGLDSTAIICAMARLRDGRADARDNTLHAFSYHSPRHDESPYIASTLAATGAVPTRIEFTPRQWWDGLPDLLRIHDEPVHSASASVGYEIYRAASLHGIKVMLVGQGADETLAGYPSYFHDQWVSLLGAGRWRAFLDDVGDYSAAHGGSRGRRVAQSLLRFLLASVDRLAVYRLLMDQRRLARDYPGRDGLGPRLAGLLPNRGSIPPKGLRAALVASTASSPLPLYLRIEDRNSMAHSVEARVPFLDHRLVELAFRLAGHWKIRGRWNKYLLREASRGRMPELVRARLDKMGFPTPMSDWLRGELKPMVADFLNGPGFRQRELVAPGVVDRLLRDGVPDAPGDSAHLFNLVQTELWLRGLAETGAG